MKYFYYILVVTALSFSSCKNNDAEKEQAIKKDFVPFTQQNTTNLQNQSGQKPVDNKHNLFNQNSTVTNSIVASGVNPEHGQPNHNCDIPVGAPLNNTSKSVNTTQQNKDTHTTPVVPHVQNSVAQKTILKGMNPPHGAVGHRCDISVGVPLNSKPVVNTVAKPVSEKPKVEQPKVEQKLPELLSTTTTEASTPKGMNPPHGKEGHQCGIAVGAPLTKE